MASSIKGDAFGPQPPPLLEYLQHVLRGYSDGQILKELLQNAEDAGASEVKFIYDKRQFGTTSLFEPTLAKFQGPAVLAFNDAQFSHDDWGAIQRPARSDKKEDVLKVGRFGIGFSSVYHLTDLPCIISGSSIAIIDPFEEHFTNVNNRPVAGSKWNLADVLNQRACSDQLAPFREAFLDQETFWQGDQSFKGTLFRFPLRRTPSSLCGSVYSEDETTKVFNSFRQDASVVMLFLRNVEKISLLVREPQSNRPTPYLDVKVTAEDMSNIRTIRKNFNALLERSKGVKEHTEDIEMLVKLDITMNDHSGSQISQSWISCQAISYKCSKQLKDLAERLHFLPWVGIAIELTEERKSKNSPGTSLDGRIFCFLPLPYGEPSRSGLPVHVHGYFGVSDDRRSLKWPGGDHIQNETALWNKLLVEEVLPGVYIKAVLKAIDVCRGGRKGPNVIYNALPNTKTELGNWKGMVKSFYKEIFKHPVLYVKTRKTWEHVDSVIIDDLPDRDQGARPVIMKSLVIGGFLVVENLPCHVLEAIKQFVRGAKFVNAQRVLKGLRSPLDEPLDHFGQDERLQLLTYLLNNNCTAQDLNALEILPVGDGHFTKFVASPKSEDYVYLSSNQCKEELLPHLKHRFVGSLKSRFRELQNHLNAMGHADHWKQLKYLTPQLVVSLLKETLPSEWKGEYATKTILDERHGIFLRSWPNKLWEFAFHHIKLSELEGLNLLPVTDVEKNPIELVTLKQGSRVVSCSSAARKNYADIVAILSKLGIIVCELPFYVTKHYDLTKSNFAQQFDSNGVMNTLRKTDKQDIERLCQGNSKFREKFYKSLLPFLNCRNMTREDKNFVKKLQIFQACNTIHNYSFTSVSSGVSLLEEGCEKRLPAVTLPRMVFITKHEVLRSFFRQIGVKELKENDIVKEILVSFQAEKFSAKDKQMLTSWIGTSFRQIRQIEGCLEILKASSFVPNGAEEERRVCEVFDPSDELLKSLLTDRKLFPSETFLQQDGGVWTTILPDLGYLTRDDVDQNLLKMVADEISSIQKHDQADALCRFLAVKPKLLEFKVDSCNTLRDYLFKVSFVRCRRERPVKYPSRLPFLGELHTDVLFTPEALVLFSEKNWQLSGSSALLVEGVPEDIGIRKEPTVEEVSNHLRQLIEHFSVTSQTETSMLHAIYSFLNDQASHKSFCSYLPTKCIWTGEGFKSPESVCLKDTVVDLRPFIFVIPREYRSYRQLYEAVQISANVTTKDLLHLLRKAKDKADLECKKDVKNLIDLATRILKRLLETEKDLKPYATHLFVPTVSNELLPPEEVSFCDYDWLKHSQLTGEEVAQAYQGIKLISDDFSINMARRLGVIPLSSRLAMADEIADGITQTGQYESITTRIRNILNDAGYQSTSIPKEMIQNAEDAGATEVRFLIDLRTNKCSMKRLLDQEMRSLQGPALWVYNNSVFSDIDLENITKLGGGTKSEDSSKIGKFGLGFNSIYHITDVPSFVTRHFVNFFDPHRKFLKSQIRGNGRGIRLNFKTNPKVAAMFRDQFQPYDGIFGCHMSGISQMEYGATLFRLPLRGPKEAQDSEICKETYTESKLKLLMKSVCDTSSQLLLFTEKVKSIEVHLLEDSDGIKPTLLFSANKETVSQNPNLPLPFREHVSKRILETGSKMPSDTICEIKVENQWTETGKRYFQETSQESGTEYWITAMSAGKETAVSLCREKTGNVAGLLPCGGIAWRKFPPSKKFDGQVFCGLPLSVPKSHLPVHINGSFALSDDRSKLWQDSCNSIDPEASFKSKWNTALFEDVILSAYLTCLEQENVGKYCSNSVNRCFLWPNLNETSTNGDYGRFVLAFYTAVAKGTKAKQPRIFWDNQTCQFAISQIAFVDKRFERSEKIFRMVSEMITRMGKAHAVFKLPQYVIEGFQKAGCSGFVDQQTYSFARFYTEIFLPNLGKCRDEDNSLLQLALTECDHEVLNLIKTNDCIPASPNGEKYKIPSDLFDPSALGELFSSDEGFFPSHSFLSLLNDRQKGTLRDLGCLKTSLQWKDLIDRALTIPRLWAQNKDRAFKLFDALMMEMERRLGDSAQSGQTFMDNFKNICFIPAKDQHRNQELKCANDLFLQSEEDLVGTVSFIVKCNIPRRVREFLGLEHKKPNSKLVLENLSNISKRKGLGSQFFQSDRLRDICSKIYVYLQNKLHDSNVVCFLCEKDCFLVEDTFVRAAKLSFGNDSVPPYMYKVSNDFRNLHSLLRKANVRESFDVEDLIKVLDNVQADYCNQPLPNTLLHDVLTKVVKPLANKIENSEFVSDDSRTIFLPDADGILRPSCQLSFCDVGWLNSKEVVLCHKDIPSPHAVLLGVLDIRRQLLENCSDVIHGYLGEDFGQREELTNRLKRILTGYPCDFSILKEIVQNADDAGASEVHFILDKGTYPAERLLKESMKSLQGAALLAFNDKPFTEEDIQGIQKLGEGSKRAETYKTGRYGVGFNVVYHLTDCPMFLTGDKICVMDPTLRYVPGASVKSPGRMYNDIRNALRKVCPDFLECFFTFNDQLQLTKGTLFRFPLRKEGSELSDVEWTPNKVQVLLNSFKEEIFDVLLFLKSVRKINISVREKESKKLENTYTVEAQISNHAETDRMTFYKHLFYHANTPVTQIPVMKNCCEVFVKSSDGYQEQWIVQQSIGLNEKSIPSSVSKALITERIDLRLLPKGGVAARFSTNCKKEMSGFVNVPRKVEHKAFCLLPLPLSTGLPVHVDGYFALDHEARRNLWCGPVGDPKNDWNTLIKERIIGLAYIQLLLEVKNRVTSLTEENKNRSYVIKVLRKFHELFPKFDRQNKQKEEDPWNCVSKTVYTEIAREKYALFPVVKPLSTSDSTEGEVVVHWKCCIENAHETGYVDDLFNTFDNTRKEDTEKENRKILQSLLIKLGFPLLSTPFAVYQSILNALEEEGDNLFTNEGTPKSILKVSPDVVIDFLKKEALFVALKGLPKDLEQTPIQTKRNLDVLLQYVTKAEKYENKLDSLPLLLTCDGTLRLFSKDLKVFSSVYRSLLPNCKNEFLHDQFRSLISKESDVFAKFEITDLARRLNKNLDEASFCSHNLVPWSHGPMTRKKDTTPSVEWLKTFWKFLSKREGDFDSREAFVKHCIQYLGKWALIPVTVEKEQSKVVTFLMPLEMGKAVLLPAPYSAYKAVYDVLVNLQIPALDLSPMRQETSQSISTPSTLLKLEKFQEIPTFFVTRIENRCDVLQVLDYLLDINYEGFVNLSKDQCRLILEHMGVGSSNLVKTHGDSVLKRLPCYETIQGSIVPLDKKVYSIAISDLPTEGNDEWLMPSNSIFLKKDKIPGELSKALNVEELDEVDLYRKFILPHFRSFPEDTMWYHLEKIMNMVLKNLSTRDEREKLIKKLNLAHISLIECRSGQVKVVTELYDPEHAVFKVMLTEDCFPSKFKRDDSMDQQMRWLRFLRLIGMKTEVTVSQYLKFVQDVSSGPGEADKSFHKADPKGQKDYVLFQHLRRTHSLHSNEDLLNKISKLQFISSQPPEGRVCKLFNPTLAKKIRPNAALASKCTLVWSIEPLCPEWVNPLEDICDSKSKQKENCLKKWKEKLGINTKPSLIGVLRHTQTLCNNLTFANTLEGKAVTFFGQILLDIVCDILKFLSSQCENISTNKSSGEPQKACSSKYTCCQNCKLIVEQLESVPFVPVDEGRMLTKASMVVKTMITEENCNIFMYLKKLPDKLIPYYSTLQCIGATEQPTLEQYATVLGTISTITDLTNQPNLIAAVTQAMSGFIKCLHRKQNDDHTRQILSQMPALYLMTKFEGVPIAKSSSLFHNDVAQFSKRLKEFPHPLLKAISQEDVGTNVNVDELLKILPEHLRPRFISEFVEEKIVTSVEHATIERCQCAISRKLRKIVTWEQFPSAIKCIVAHELKTGNSPQTDDKMAELMSSTFTIKCIEKLQTSLFFEGREIAHSQSDTLSLFRMNQELKEIAIYISHDANPLHMYRQLAKNFNNIFKLVTDTTNLELILGAENEEDLSNLLNMEGIGTAGLEEESFWNLPELGSNIQDDVIALLNQDIMYIFYEKEYVGLDYGEGNVELFIYARVVRRIDDGSSNDKPWRINYDVQIGKDEIRRIPAHKLYKFITPGHPDSFALTVYSGPLGDSSEGQDVPGAVKSEQDTTESQDLNATKREITRTLEDIMTMQEEDKRKTIRRLLLKWHPDKHLTKKEFAEEIFKHIQTELDRLQNMNTFSRENFYDDIHQRARRYEEERRHWQERYRASSSSSWNTRKRRHHGEHEFYPPPSFHRRKNTLEGRRHLKQALVDFSTADDLENSHFRYQWKCQLYFFASEKALKAAQLASGRNTSSDCGILRAAESLQEELDMMDSVRSLISIVKKDSHYPESCVPPGIPQEEFTSVHSQEARKVSWDILKTVEKFIEYEED
ncbi:Sacsin [Holothuria leucospilota]|uniref:Sacsin n=1 Tax=Holothuria leucospilota TaxID=206669 RepID=A0A9Q1BEM8_HOLLE|nr:Sacsin [Holothuria leucospilota]